MKVKRKGGRVDVFLEAGETTVVHGKTVLIKRFGKVIGKVIAKRKIVHHKD